MIGLIVIVLVFVAAGVGVVALAIRGGRRPSARSTKRTQPLVGIGVALVTILFGVGAPAAVIAYNANTQAKQAAGGVVLSAEQQEGRKVFAAKCATCHTLAAANAVGRVGPSLDAIIPPIADEKARVAFVKDAIAKGRARGTGQMPSGLVDGIEEQNVADFIAVSAGR